MPFERPHTRAADGHTTARIHSKYSLPHHVPVAYVALFATSHPEQHGLNRNIRRCSYQTKKGSEFGAILGSEA
jgi:hypothetical protein